jgi:hypothetical protein
MGFIDLLLIIDSFVENVRGYKTVTRVEMFNHVPIHFALDILFCTKFTIVILVQYLLLPTIHF